MTRLPRVAAAYLAVALIAGVGPALAGGGPVDPDRGAGTSGKSDGSGMGQDNTESGKAKGPGDKPQALPEAADRKASPTDTPPVSPKNCDDGTPPVSGSCQK
ncbi:hypothetical protein [Methylopila sp. M107]|uniref:hypothetical protein n=1 Tax=Methylopila sp. M107 TaxID=1101190 RepID=UPI0012DCEBA2|nr:hypothetical protein [Methylopila sp. M107]